MNPTSPRHDSDIEDQAALWAARLEGSTLTAADRAALDAWLQENPAHRTLLSQYCQFSADLEEKLPALVAAGAIALPPAKAPARRWSFPSIAFATLATAAVAAFAIWLARPHQQHESFATAAAQRQTLTLADGSRVELNARTSLQVDIGGAERHVRLASGEAFFTVSKDKSRPFIVDTPAGSVRVTGTVFNVLTDSAISLNVTVVEGSVLVRPGQMGRAQASDPSSLHPGDEFIAGPEGVAVRQLSAGALDNLLAWREGKIVFDAVPLREALARVGHFHGRNLTAAPDVAERRLGGRYSIDDLDEFLTAIGQPLGVQATRDPSGNVVVSSLPAR